MVAAAPNERSYHIFYSLLAADKTGMGSPKNYNYLSRTETYDAVGIDDKKYFQEIEKSMKSIGFDEK